MTYKQKKYSSLKCGKKYTVKIFMQENNSNFITFRFHFCQVKLLHWEIVKEISNTNDVIIKYWGITDSYFYY